MRKLIVIVGESGSGKSLIEKTLCESGLFLRFISTTTRYIRKGEVNGREYYFISVAEFDKFKKENKFVETAEYDTEKTTGIAFKYGLYRSELKKLQKQNCIFVATPEGYFEIKNEIGKENIQAFYIKTDGEIRKERTLVRYGEEKDKYIDEVNRRFEADKLVFNEFSKLNEVKILANNYTEKDLANNCKIIIEECFQFTRKMEE